MKRRISIAAVVLLFIGALSVLVLFHSHDLSHDAIAQEESSESAIVKLPSPKLDGPVSVEKALAQRRSIRTYKDEPLNLVQVSQILWAAQGITDPKSGKRTAPSAMALYLLELYLISGNISDLPQGTYKYRPDGHELVEIAKGDTKTKLFESVGQAPIKNAPAVIVITGDSKRSRNPNWIYLEAGHAAQNVYLQGVSLKLGTVVMAGFKDDEVRKALSLSKEEQPLYIMPLGKK